MNTPSTTIFKKFVYIFIVLVVVAIVVWAFVWQGIGSTGSVSYTDEHTGISLDHARRLTMTPVSTDEPATLFYLDAPGNKIIFASFIKDPEYVERDQRFYDSVLFKEPEQTVNSRITIGEYFGYKAVIDASTYRYTLYRPITASSSLIIRSELAASSSPEIALLEQDFLSMISSITLGQARVDK